MDEAVNRAIERAYRRFFAAILAIDVFALLTARVYLSVAEPVHAAAADQLAPRLIIAAVFAFLGLSGLRARPPSDPDRAREAVLASIAAGLMITVLTGIFRYWEASRGSLGAAMIAGPLDDFAALIVVATLFTAASMGFHSWHAVAASDARPAALGRTANLFVLYGWIGLAVFIALPTLDQLTVAAALSGAGDVAGLSAASAISSLLEDPRLLALHFTGAAATAGAVYVSDRAAREIGFLELERAGERNPPPRQEEPFTDDRIG